MKDVRFAAAAAVLFTFSVPAAFAHDDAYLATQKAPNGGQLRVAGPYHYELVTDRAAPGAAAHAILVYVTDHAGTPVATQGAQGVAHVLAGKERASLPLASDGGNRMKALSPYVVAADAKLVVSITIPGAQPAQARFAAEPAGASASPHAPNPNSGPAH